MSHRMSLDEKIAALVEQKKAEKDPKKKDPDMDEVHDREDASKSKKDKKDDKDMDESDAKHKRPADKDQKEKEEVSKTKQVGVKEDDEDDEDEEDMDERKDEDDEDEDKKVAEQKDDEDDEDEEDMDERKDEDDEDEEDMDERKDEDDEDEDSVPTAKKNKKNMKESDAAHRRKADKEQREKHPPMKKAKGQDSAQQTDPDNKKAFDYTQTKPNFSVGEDIEALFNGEDLSEEFKTKATTILEAAVNRHLDKALEQIQEDVDARLQEEDEARTKALVEQVSKYLDYVVEEWLEENKLAIERGYAIETTQDFITGLKGLFQEHYIEVPDVPKNVLDELQDKLYQQEKDLNEALNRIIDLSTDNEEKKKEQIFSDVTSELTDTQVDKFRELSESVEFSGDEDYRDKLDTIKTNYFPNEQKSGQEIGDSVDGGFEPKAPSTPQVKAYADALTRTLAHKKL